MNTLVPFAQACTTSHSVSNAPASIDGDEALLIALVESQRLPVADGSRHFTMKNRRDLILTHADDAWRISRMAIGNRWTDGDLTATTGA